MQFLFISMIYFNGAGAEYISKNQIPFFYIYNTRDYIIKLILFQILNFR